MTETDDQIGATDYSGKEVMRAEEAERAPGPAASGMSTMRSSEGFRLTEGRLRARLSGALLLLTRAPGEVGPVAPPADHPRLPGAQPPASEVPHPQMQGRPGTGTEATLTETLWSLTGPGTAPRCPGTTGDSQDTSRGPRPSPRPGTRGLPQIWTQTQEGRGSGTMRMATPVTTAQVHGEVGQ